MESLDELIQKVKRAQKKFATYTQEQVDEIFKRTAMKANELRIHLARLAVEETGMGVWEDKVLKNHYASEYIYNRYKDEKTCGIVERDEENGYARYLEPVGVVGAIVPTTNPTSTTIFKILLCLKTRNGLIISPHPRAKNCTVETAKLLLQTAVEAGAPEDIIGWIQTPSVEKSTALMRGVDLILATGGPQMVRSAYSSGKPAVGVGAGNTPAVVHPSANIRLAVSSILHSKTFDNGVICASEQSVVVEKSVYEKVRQEFEKQGAYILTDEQAKTLADVMFEKGVLNAKVVGQTAQTVARLAGFSVPKESKVLIAEVEKTDESEPFAREKLSPVLAMYKAENFADAVDKADALVHLDGMGHTACVYMDENKFSGDLETFNLRMKACRILVNTPASQGGIGDMYNFRLTPSLTLGCGSWGGNSVCENVGVKQLLNVKTVAERRENMLWFRAPQKVYFKRGSLSTALKELGKGGYDRKRAFIVTDKFLYDSGVSRKITQKLDELAIEHTEFFEVTPDPTLECVLKGVSRMQAFCPDVIIAVGGGSPMDAGKIMWLLYEHPNLRFEDIAMRFMDIRKRVFKLPKLGEKALFIAVPTTAGTGSEVTPFAVITDEKTGAKYPLADYELMPTVAICDADLMLDIPKGLTANAGFDALSHAMEAIASAMASDYTDALGMQAIKQLVLYLPLAYEQGKENITAREKVANGATMAGIAFANAFLGLCHSMAHKLGSYFHLPHGMANALLLVPVMRFNAHPSPKKMATFPQYAWHESLKRYALVARAIGLEGQTDDELFEKLIDEIERLKARLNLPKNIQDALGEKVSRAQFESVVEQMSIDAFDDQCTGANPRYPLVEEIKELYLKAYDGGK